jgi:hypothetical protein
MADTPKLILLLIGETTVTETDFPQAADCSRIWKISSKKIPCDLIATIVLLSAPDCEHLLRLYSFKVCVLYILCEFGCLLQGQHVALGSVQCPHSTRVCL